MPEPTQQAGGGARIQVPGSSGLWWVCAPALGGIFVSAPDGRVPGREQCSPRELEGLGAFDHELQWEVLTLPLGEELKLPPQHSALQGLK